MFVLMEDAAEAVTSTDVKVRDRVWISARLRQRVRRSGVRDPPMGPMGVVKPLVLAQSMQQMRLVPDQGPVQQFVAAALDPPFREGVHAGHLDAAEHNLDVGRRGS